MYRALDCSWILSAGKPANTQSLVSSLLTTWSMYRHMDIVHGNNLDRLETTFGSFMRTIATQFEEFKTDSKKHFASLPLLPWSP